MLDGTWSPPVTDGSGRDRATLKRALALFAPRATSCAAPSSSNATSGRPFTFEIMVTARDEERLALLFAQSLKRAGIERAYAWSTRCSTKDAASPTTST